MHLFQWKRKLLTGNNWLHYVFMLFKDKLVSSSAMLSDTKSQMKYKNKIKILNGVRYRSQLELTCATLLTQNNIAFEYEPYEVRLVDSAVYPGVIYEKKTKRKQKVYSPSRGNIRSISYTPDFVGDNWIIETKGYETPEFKLKWKLFQHELIKQGISPHLFKPTSKREILETINLIKQLEHVKKEEGSGRTRKRVRRSKSKERV